MNNKISTTRFIVGGLLIILGGSYLLDNLNIIRLNLFHYLFSLPGLMMFVGLVSILNSHKKGFGLILFTTGSLWMASRYMHVDFWDYFWGVLLLVIGLYILLKPRTDWSHKFHQARFMKSDTFINKDKIDDVAIFGGGEKRLASDNFQGGNITAIFGGSEIDLSQCKLATGENILDMFILFGGTTLIVPADWNIIVDVFPLFGGFKNSRIKDPSRVYDPNKTLVLKGIVMFGGGELKSFL